MSARLGWANTLATLDTISAFLALTRSVLRVLFRNTWKSFVYTSRFSWTNDSLERQNTTVSTPRLKNPESRGTRAADAPLVGDRSGRLRLGVGLLPRVSPRLDVAEPRLQHLNTQTAVVLSCIFIGRPVSQVTAEWSITACSGETYRSERGVERPVTEAVLEEQVELLLNEALHHHSAGGGTRYDTFNQRRTLITGSVRPAAARRARWLQTPESYLRVRLLTGEQGLMGCSGCY